MTLTKEEYLEIISWYAKKCYYESKHSHENAKTSLNLGLSGRALEKLRAAQVPESSGSESL